MPLFHKNLTASASQKSALSSLLPVSFNKVLSQKSNCFHFCENDGRHNWWLVVIRLKPVWGHIQKHICFSIYLFVFLFICFSWFLFIQFLISLFTWSKQKRFSWKAGFFPANQSFWKLFKLSWLAGKQPALQKRHHCFDRVNRLNVLNIIKLWCNSQVTIFFYKNQ